MAGPHLHRFEILHVGRIEKHVPDGRSAPVDLVRIASQYNPLENDVHRIALGQLAFKDRSGFDLTDVKLVDPEH